ncbi:MAG TPA: molybdopterin-dependent oxidoreductase, partial [Thermoleophilaceae bacterium]
MPSGERITFCRNCEALCGLIATVDDGRVVKLRPDALNPASRGAACPKGIAMTDVQNDPDRVLHPLRRLPGGDGFERVSWEEAMDGIAARLRAIRRRHGRRSVGWYAGVPYTFSFGHYTWSKGFIDSLRSPHFYGTASQDVSSRLMASQLLYGTVLEIPIPDLQRTDFLLCLGANPFVSNGSVLTAPRMRERLMAIAARGGRVVAVDPRRSETARAFEHVPIRPDTDAWLL